MLYRFSGFILDVVKKELIFQSSLVNLTKQNFQLLHYFVTNPNKVINKDELIENVWNGRVVADNSIDQSIYKLKKVLCSIKEDSYFETVYGLGIKFSPHVELVSTNQEPQQKKYLSVKIGVIVITLSLILLSLFYFRGSNQKSTVDLSNGTVVILPSKGIISESDWLASSSDLYMEKLLMSSSKVTLKNYQNKPQNLNQQQYLESQWKLNPLLKVISTEVSFENDNFIVQLSIKDKAGHSKEKEFQSQNLTTVYSKVMVWLNAELNLGVESTATSWIVPDKPYLLELYLRGLSAFSQHKTDQAINYFELCLENDSDFPLAQLELAKLFERKGDINKALALLETILSINKSPEITIEASNQKGGILLRQGKPQEAKELYLNLLKDNRHDEYQGITDTRYKLALVYRSLSQKDKALDEFNSLELVLKESDDFGTLADVYQAKASILLSLGQTKEAATYAQQAMDLFVSLGDLMGQAKTHSVTARIARQSADDATAVVHLKQALNITRSLKHSFGIGATLNEIIDVLIAQGKINEAWKLNQELEKIAIQIDFNAMLLASKRFTVLIAEQREHWQAAEIYLKEHLEIAQASDNRPAIVSNRFMSISLLLKQNKLEQAKKDLEDFENYIYQSKDQGLRLHFNAIKSQYLFQSQQLKKAMDLLMSSKILANANGDGQAYNQLNNLLAKVYLQQNNAHKALQALEDSSKYNPAAYPHLLLKSQAQEQLKNFSRAIMLANDCKQQSNDLWTSENERYLAQLLERKKSEK